MMDFTKFQSTLPAGEATKRTASKAEDPRISIHASRGGSDGMLRKEKDTMNTFQSTLPAGEATVLVQFLFKVVVISIHASRGGSDPPASWPFP